MMISGYQWQICLICLLTYSSAIMDTLLQIIFYSDDEYNDEYDGYNDDDYDDDDVDFLMSDSDDDFPIYRSRQHHAKYSDMMARRVSKATANSFKQEILKKKKQVRPEISEEQEKMPKN
ncbi:uncharacterized protein LOC124444797 isoform X2 [Xenia sp. Carnegie-2017]|uniref:uncharacterized protein LOC124444797 isoform X2 n=1 Tax=Xenia sp. Carnegie-2017 TaxID=2897299 RepID=UPI001F04CCFD|nr:uncharacterized protein LOC124444797 isoform X2 [Xenia sp. Carnegie-2017]